MLNIEYKVPERIENKSSTNLQPKHRSQLGSKNGLSELQAKEEDRESKEGGNPVTANIVKIPTAMDGPPASMSRQQSPGSPNSKAPAALDPNIQSS